MTLTCSIFILLGMLLIAYGRHHVRLARNPAAAQSPHSRRLVGWVFTFMGFLAILIGIVLFPAWPLH